MLAARLVGRAPEFAIHTALGASPWRLVRDASAETVRATTVGLIVGLAAAGLAAQALSAFLFGIAPLDPVSFLVVGMFLVGTAGLATMVPLLRVSRTNPIAALRD